MPKKEIISTLMTIHPSNDIKSDLRDRNNCKFVPSFKVKQECQKLIFKANKSSLISKNQNFTVSTFDPMSSEEVKIIFFIEINI